MDYRSSEDETLNRSLMQKEVREFLQKKRRRLVSARDEMHKVAAGIIMFLLAWFFFIVGVIEPSFLWLIGVPATAFLLLFFVNRSGDRFAEELYYIDSAMGNSAKERELFLEEFPETQQQQSPQGQWFYIINGEQFGPVAESALIEMYNTNILCDSDMVWSPSMKDWEPLGEVLPK
jgi:hypothetical protein